MSDTTAATETQAADAAAAAAAAATQAATQRTDDLDAILASVKEFREETTARETQPSHRETGASGQGEQGQGADGGSEAAKSNGAARTEALDPRRLTAIEERIVRDDVNRTIESMRTAQPALKALDAGVLEAYLNSQAQRDPRIRAAWLRRDSDPGTFGKVVSGLARRMAAGLPVPADADAGADRAAAVTAARGATQQAADDEDRRVLAMSDAEFEQDWKKSARSGRRR